MTARRPLRSLAVAAVLPLTLVLAGCNGSDDSSAKGSGGTPSSSASSSTGATTAAGSSSGGSADAADAAEPGATLTAADLAALYSRSFSGDDATVAISMKSSFGEQETSAAGVADFTSAQPRMQYSLTIPQAGNASMRLIDGTAYLRFAATKGKWMAFSTDAKTGPMAAFGELAKQYDVRSSLETLSKSASDIVYVGPKTIGGAQTRLYTFTVDNSAAIEGLSSLTSAQKGAVPKTSEQELYVGGDGKIVRSVTKSGQIDVTVDYSKWGVPVSIEKPAKGDVVDGDAMMGS